MKEIWKDVLEYEGLYQVSNLGRVRSLYNRNIKILKAQKNKNGYLHLGLKKDGKVKNFLVHCLVWEVFKGKKPEGYEVNHINEDKTDNRLCNLNLMTRKENCNHGTRNRRIGKKLSKPVGQFTLDGVLVKIWECAKECGRNGYSQGNVSACCRNCYIREGNNIYKRHIWKNYESSRVNQLHKAAGAVH